MHLTPSEASAFILCGALIPCVGTAILFSTPAPIAGWLVALILYFIITRK